MKKFLLALLLGFTVSLSAVEAGFALVPAGSVDQAWLAKARTAYPLNKCLVSDEAFGGKMGDPVEFVYRLEGKPDRLVRLCCKMCMKDFKKNPDQYLKLLDQAAEPAKKG